MRGRGVLHLRRRVADVRTQHDERRAACSSAIPARSPASIASRSFGHLAELHDVPAVRLEALRHVVAVRELGRTVDGDVVVVVDEHHAPELEVPGERRRLVADALHQVAVAADAEDAVVAHVGAEPRAQVLLAIAIPTAFAMPWPSGPVVTSTPVRVAELRVAGRARAPLAELRGCRRARARTR